jgi:hypothetical protein
MRVEDFRPARKRSSTDWQDLLDLTSRGTVRVTSFRGGGNHQAGCSTFHSLFLKNLQWDFAK